MTDLTLPSGDSAENINLREALETRYLAYALSTITNRALPDARDGLKPVHRRLLFAMRQLKLDPENSFKKCARVVGDVIGRYHPHGDQAVYDALVRLAQNFAVRYPLVDGQGNFGNIDGDSAAAMRYTESRLTEIASLLLKDINQDTVDFRTTYDGEESEPIVLPGAFPNLLANGASGIAVGMATNIPPHNIGELCAAALHLIKAPNARIDTLLEHVKGPDFPTGGIIIESPETIRNCYATGRGSIRVRARYEVENLGRGTWQIIVTEIPYQVQKSRLIEKIAELMQAKSLPMLDDIRDESAEDIRLVIVPKSKNMQPDQVMNVLFRQTDLEARYSVNLNVLNTQGVPGVLNLRELLLEWLNHRKTVLVRKSTYRLGKIDARLEILEGYLIAYLNLDEVIRIIREEDDPQQELMASFKLTQNQAEAILNMRLRALRKLEEMTIKTEHESLKKERKELKALLGSDEKQWQVISDEVKELKKTYDAKSPLGARRTTFEEVSDSDVVMPEILVEKEPITVICSQKGWVRAMKGHLEDAKDVKYKTGDKARFVFPAQTTDKLVVMASNGRAYIIEASKLPGGRGNGEPLSLMIDLEASDEIIQIFTYDEARQLIVATRSGNGFVVEEKELMSNRRAGKQIVNLKTPDELACCVPVSGDHIAVLGENRKLLVFPLTELPVMTRGKGVRLQKYADGELADIRCYDAQAGLTVIDKAGRSRVFEELKEWEGSRAQAGRVRPKGFPTDGLMGPAFPNIN